MSKDMKFDLTPDPKVLIALTHTPIQQLDALCELVDNAIDSFNTAKKQGISISQPLIAIDLPKVSEIDAGLGVVRITDNGPGLTSDMMEKALRAGFSGNNPYDNLGLFGMGFNISTGKIGCITTMSTARIDEREAIKVVIDLEKINKNKSFQVIPDEIDKPFEQGTCIEITDWWPEGNFNNGFIRKLVQYGYKKIREELGRRYATILREKNIRLMVNNVICEPYEHCTWDEKKFVTRQKHGEIPAMFRFSQVIHTQKKCNSCTTMLESFQDTCPTCGSKEIRTLEEKIEGWVGIQRFDDMSNYGVDLIRNGRAIRIAEKSAFFEFVDDFKKVIKDYPIDSNFGRIVGEVHLNHVPVDFLKQDFQRSSPEWQRAMVFLRGESSLQPTQPGADNNHSPIFKLYQGYRKVKTPGKTDMYMGYWDTVKQEPHRISRDVEKEYYQKFINKEQGFYNDEEWWKKVEEADKKPIPELPKCPSCGAQNLETVETCSVCGHIFKGKTCINEQCRKQIAFSLQTCPFCGTSQEIKTEKPWICEVCGTKNTSEEINCIACGEPKGTINHLTMDYMLEHANKDDYLSIDDCSIKLANGKMSSALKVSVYVMNQQIKPNLSSEIIPIISFKDQLDEINIFVDKMHSMFDKCQIIPEQLIAAEIADRIFVLNRGLSNVAGIHTIPMLSWQIIDKYWAENLEDKTEKISLEIENFMKLLKDRLAITIGEDSEECFAELSDEQKKLMVNNMINDGVDISNLKIMQKNGAFIKFVEDDFISRLFDMTSALFFDGRVWEDDYLNIQAEHSWKRMSQERVRNMYKSCIDDIIAYRKLNIHEKTFAKRASYSLEFLMQKVVKDVY